MRVFLLVFGITIFIFQSFSQDSTLFVGNSMVKYDKNHTLEILDKMLNQQSVKHVIDDMAFNGCTLNKHVTTLPAHKENFFGSQHWSTNKIELAQTPTYILRHHFDKVLFQEEPMRVVDSVKFLTRTKNDFYRLDSLTKLHADHIYWLEPYAAIYYYFDKNSKTNLDSLYAIIQNRSSQLKEIDSNLKIVPIAYITKEFIKKYPKEGLQIGGNHPNKRMQFMLACCLYYSMYNGKPEEIPFLHWFRNDRNQMKEKGLREYTYKLYQEYLVNYK